MKSSGHYIIGEEIKTTENRNYEFKAGGVLFQSSTLEKLIEKYGTALLNSKGGIVMCGVNDNGKCYHIYITLEDTILT